MFCRDCGTLLSGDDKFCGVCGKKIADETVLETEQEFPVSAADDETIFIGSLGEKIERQEKLLPEMTESDAVTYSMHSSFSEQVINADSNKKESKKNKGRLKRWVIGITVFLFALLGVGTAFELYQYMLPQRAVETMYQAYQAAEWEVLYESIEWPEGSVSREEFTAKMNELDLIALLLNGEVTDRKLRILTGSAGAEYSDGNTGRKARNISVKVEFIGFNSGSEKEIKVITSDETILFIFRKWKVAGDDIQRLISEIDYVD